MDSSKMDNFWEDPPPGGMNHGSHGHGQHLPYERNLNFSTVAIEDSEYGFPKKKTVRDPLSHRIIEKRRRDRMNNCLADLARLLPPSSLRKGRGRIEKTEIVELAIKHLRHLQCHACPHSDNCEYSRIPTPRSNSSSHQKSSSLTGSSPSSSSSDGAQGSGGSPEEHFRIGFQESMSETMHFLVEQEGMYAGDDMCVRLVKHLNNHCDALLQNYIGNKRKMSHGFNPRSSSMGKKPEEGSLSSGYQPNGSSGSGSSEEQENFRDGYGSSSYTGKSFSQGGQNMTNISGGGHQDSLATVTNFDYDGDQNSCSSAQLSIEISDAYSQDGKMGRPQTKPPIPAIIGSHSSSNNRDVSNVCVGSSGSPPVNSSNSDEGNSTITSASSPSNHRYKFKNKIKQRFTEDTLQTGNRHEGNGDRRKGNQSRQSQYEGGDELDRGADPRSPQPSGNETDNPRDNFDEVVRRSSIACDSLQGKRTKENNVQVEKRKDSIDSRKILSEDEATFGDKCGGGKSLIRAESPVEQKPIVEDLLLPPTRITNTSSTPIIPITIANMTTATGGSLKEAKALAVCGPTEVPAFALHDKGLYYIPLTIDKSIVAPFIKSMEPNTQPPLHPVTISVCFLLSPNDEKKITVTPATKLLGATSSSLPIHHAAASSPSIFDPSDVHHPPPVEIIREPNNFIMNRFAQSQVPMIFGSPLPTTKESSNYGPCKTEAMTPALRYPFSLGGSSHGSGSTTSDPSAKLYHHIDNRAGPVGGSSGSGYFASSGSSSSASVGADSAHLPRTVAGSSSSSSSGLRGNSRKRSISSGSPSLGYHSWTDKSGSEADAYIHGPPLPLPSVTAATAGIPGVGVSNSTPLEVIDEGHPSGRRSSFGAHLPHKVHPTVTLYPGDQLSPDREALRASRDGKSTFSAKRSRKGRGDDGGSGSSSSTGSSFRQSVSSI